MFCLNSLSKRVLQEGFFQYSWVEKGTPVPKLNVKWMICVIDMLTNFIFGTTVNFLNNPVHNSIDSAVLLSSEE